MLNIPPDEFAPLRVIEQVKRLEGTDGPAYPPAFLFFTNHPCHYVNNEQPEPGRQTMFTGINISAFHGSDSTTADRYLTQERPAVLALYDSVMRHVEIPRSFD